MLDMKMDIDRIYPYLPERRTVTAFNPSGTVTTVAPDNTGPLTVDEWGNISHAPMSYPTPRSPSNIPFWQKFFGNSGGTQTIDIGPTMEDEGGMQFFSDPNMGLISNPALENFSNVVWGNPLNANYEDTVAQASGQDPMGWITNPVGQAGAYALGLEEGSGDSVLRLPGVFDLSKDSLKQAGVFIVGAIILGIGILALTRGN